MTKNSTNYYVYGHYKKSDSSLFYVGKGIGYRASSKKNRNKYWHNIVNKHGLEIKYFAKGLSEEAAYELEILLIKELSPIANFTKGGDGGNTFIKKSEEEIKSIIQKRKTDPKKLATYGFLGKKHSEERNRLLSEKHKGKLFKPFTEVDAERMRSLGKKRSIKVQNIETGEIYESIRDCSRKTGISKSWIIWNLKRGKKFISLQRLRY